jgi:uncharacterized membrane protein YhaH (DUF805 family)
MSLTMQPPLDWPHYGINFGGAVKRAFIKGLRFDGRASRAEYWWFVLFTGLFLIGLSIPALVLGVSTSPDGGDTPGPAAVPLLILIALFWLAIIVPSISLTVRRLHDAGYSGWLVLLNLVPYVGSLIVAIFCILPPSPAGAKYDPVVPGYNPPVGR